MAYQTGLAVDVNGLMDAVIAFAVANAGYTESTTWVTTDSPRGTYWGAGLDGNWTVRTLLKGGLYNTFQYKINALYMNTATSLSGAGAVQAQPGAHLPVPNNSFGDNPANYQYGRTVNAAPGPMNGPYVGYHLFTDGKMVNVAIELVPLVFAHFSFGLIEGVGSIPDFQGVTAMCYRQPVLDQVVSYNVRHPWSSADYGTPLGGSGDITSSSTHIRNPITGFTADSHYGAYLNRQIFHTPAHTAQFNVRDTIYRYGPNEFNARAPLIPIDITVASNPVSVGPYIQLGHVTNARFVNMKYLNPKDVVDDDWMVFPMQQQNGPATVYMNTENLGIAYRK